MGPLSVGPLSVRVAFGGELRCRPLCAVAVRSAVGDAGPRV